MRRREQVIAAGWGFAEAVVWFVVPDVFLTYVGVRRGVRRAVWLTLYTVLGAVVGGLATYAWGALSPDTGAAVMASLPGIDAEMVARVAGEVEASGNAALLAGPRQTQPYKLYALAAGELGTSLAGLVWWTIPGRALRFLLSSAASGVLGNVGRRVLPERMVVALWAVFWVAVYAWLWLL